MSGILWMLIFRAFQLFSTEIQPSFNLVLPVPQVAHGTNACATSLILAMYDQKSKVFQITNDTDMFEVISNNQMEWFLLSATCGTSRTIKSVCILSEIDVKAIKLAPRAGFLN